MGSARYICAGEISSGDPGEGSKGSQRELFLQGDWALLYNSSKFWDFP